HTTFSRDWSSDVCSSDLPRTVQRARAQVPDGSRWLEACLTAGLVVSRSLVPPLVFLCVACAPRVAPPLETHRLAGGSVTFRSWRSEERRGGKESGCRCA